MSFLKDLKNFRIFPFYELNVSIRHYALKFVYMCSVFSARLHFLIAQMDSNCAFPLMSFLSHFDEEHTKQELEKLERERE